MLISRYAHFTREVWRHFLPIQAGIKASSSAIQYIGVFIWSVVMVSIMNFQFIRHEYSSVLGYNPRTPFLCDVITCHWVIASRRFEGIKCFFSRLSRSWCFRPFKMKKVRSSKTLEFYYAVTSCHIAEERSCQPHRR